MKFLAFILAMLMTGCGPIVTVVERVDGALNPHQKRPATRPIEVTP